jgi:2-polyprenyl-6-methoxyphenol hydroxylase-like FAD-dependent oxidoreductase
MMTTLGVGQQSHPFESGSWDTCKLDLSSNPESRIVIMANEPVQTTCCVVGGGPAGVMLGYLLARSGVDVTVLEKHQDFNRDFRGDTVHPSTLEVMYELGILDDFLKVPHQRLTSTGGVYGDYAFKAADFTSLPTHCKFVALMPQWDLLDFLSAKAKEFPSFHLRMENQAADLIDEGGRIRGVVSNTPDGPVEIHSDLVVGCDGRHSLTRQAAHFEVLEQGVPIDVLWFRISRVGNDPENLFGNINYGGALILIPRGDYFQAAMVIRKGSFEQFQNAGIDAFRERVLQIAPFLGDRVAELREWVQIKLLSVQINRLQQWHRPGLLCIGDAAHAMSPVGGVGINLAIQDAVATANLLAAPLREKRVTEAMLARIQTRREFPTRVTQFLQVNAHKALQYVFENPGRLTAPWQFKAVLSIPGIQKLPARVIGMGVLPEHIKGATALKTCPMLSLKKIAIGAGLLAAGIVIGTRIVKASRKRDFAWGTSRPGW